jgi:predicted RNA-binding Zn ribbon-like protein
MTARIYPTPREHDPDRKEGFFFLGNELILDFLNTRPVQSGQETELLPDLSALLRWFHAAGLLSSREKGRMEEKWGASKRGQQLLEEMKKLREKLRDEVVRWETSGVVQHSTIAELNSLLAKYPMLRRFKLSGREISTELYFRVLQPEDLFAPLAHSAATLLSVVDRKRVRRCQNCVLHFHDTSKKGTRRWCSMQLCGNRLKVAAYAARRRVSSARTGRKSSHFVGNK